MNQAVLQLIADVLAAAWVITEALLLLQGPQASAAAAQSDLPDGRQGYAHANTSADESRDEEGAQPRLESRLSNASSHVALDHTTAAALSAG